MNEKAQKVLELLIEGNNRFAQGCPKSQNRDVESLKKLQNSQSPMACVVTCSDSRVIPEFVFDVGFGELFTVRGAGAVIGPNILESVEYAVDHLKVPLIIVMSHECCGVMKTAVTKYPEEPQKFKVLIKSVYEIIDRNNKTYDEIAEDYTLVKKRKLLKRSEILRNAYAAGELEIVRAYLNFSTGRVTVIE